MNDQLQTQREALVVSCPQCETVLSNDSRTCPQCGVDLALIALLAERAFVEDLPSAFPLSATPASLIPRIGETLLEQELITEDQLEAALDKQSKLASENKRQLLGETMLEMGFLDRETLDMAINRQIIELHAALQESNRTLEERVTERTAELKRALERLTELNQIKANLISNISHELRTPLAHIKGYVELVVDEQIGPITNDQKNALHVAQRASDRLEELIEDLIEYSTASREGISLKLESVNLNELAEDVYRRSIDKAGQGSVRLKTDFLLELESVRADPKRLGWVMFQLLDNGIKFTPDGGLVTLKTVQQDSIITFSVSDTGIGISQDRYVEIFEPFHQLDSSETRRYGGTGLGLALVKLILDTHGTEMVVHSEPGVGSEFSFSMPTFDGAS